MTKEGTTMGRPKKNNATTAAGVSSIPVTNVTEDMKELASEIMDDNAKERLLQFYSLSKQDKAVIVSLDTENIRSAVQAYYQIQSMRINIGGKIRAIQQEKSATGNQLTILQWLYNNELGIENELKKALDKWSSGNVVASWCRQILGIGPVIASGLVTYFDIDRANSVSHFYSYSGLNDNNDPWLGREKASQMVRKYCREEKVTNDDLLALSQDPACKRSMAKLVKYASDPDKPGTYSRSRLISNLAKPPYNADLKVLLWKLGESFVKQSNKPGSLYGRIYKERFLLESQKNESGEYAEQAAQYLSAKSYNKQTESYKAYSQGKLPKAQLYARAKRYALKIFVSHLFEEMYRVRYNAPGPNPYAIVYQEHVDMFGPEVEFTPFDPNKPASRPTVPVRYFSREEYALDNPVEDSDMPGSDD
jgi:hypothetical protein